MKRRLLHLDVTSLGEQIAPSMRKPVCVKSKISEPWSGDSVEPLQRAPESRANHTSYFLRRRAGRIKTFMEGLPTIQELLVNAAALLPINRRDMFVHPNLDTEDHIYGDGNLLVGCRAGVRC